MSAPLTKAKLLEFLHRLGNSARSSGACFITGGSSAVLDGWRESTIDVDLNLYDLLRTQHGPEAYRHYRSLRRRLVSLENALDAVAGSATH